MRRMVILFCNVKQLVLKHSVVYTVFTLLGGGQLVNVACFESVKEKQHPHDLDWSLCLLQKLSADAFTATRAHKLEGAPREWPARMPMLA